MSEPSLFDGSILSDVRDPYPMFAAMRHSERVARVEVEGQVFYLALSYDDVSQVLREPDTFSSSIMRQVMGPVMVSLILLFIGWCM